MIDGGGNTARGNGDGKLDSKGGVFRDLTDPRLMYLKAALFLVAGLLCVAGIIAESPTLRTVALLSIGIWSFCRLYYFFFYVIEHYIDDTFRFSGIGSAVAYLFKRRLRP